MLTQASSEPGSLLAKEAFTSSRFQRRQRRGVLVICRDACGTALHKGIANRISTAIQFHNAEVLENPSTPDRSMRWSTSLVNCASAWRTWKGCWKGCGKPSVGGRRLAKAMMEEKYPEDATKL